MKFTILFVLVVSLFFVVFCLSKPADGVLKAETSLRATIVKGSKFQDEKKLMERMELVFNELKRVLLYDFEEEQFERMGLLLAEQGTIIDKDRSRISGKDDIRQFFEGISKMSKGRRLIIELKSVGQDRMIEAVINGYEVDKLAVVDFEIRLEEPDGPNGHPEPYYDCDMLLFHRKICWPDG